MPESLEPFYGALLFIGALVAVIAGTMGLVNRYVVGPLLRENARRQATDLTIHDQDAAITDIRGAITVLTEDNAARMDRLAADMQRVEGRLIPNGGSSLYDSVGKLRDQAERIEVGLNGHLEFSDAQVQAFNEAIGRLDQRIDMGLMRESGHSGPPRRHADPPAGD